MTKRKTRSGHYTPTKGLFAGRTFPSLFAYRNAHAKAKGFGSYHEERRAFRSVSTRRQLEKLPRLVQVKRSDSLEVLGIMRRDGLNLETAIRIFKKENPGNPISPNAVVKYVGRGLEKRSGRWVAKRYDRIMRPMMVPTRHGVIEIEVRDSRSASKIANYWNGIRDFLATGDAGQLRRSRNEYVQSGKVQYRFLTDPEAIEQLADFGEFRFESIYQELSSS